MTYNQCPTCGISIVTTTSVETQQREKEAQAGTYYDMTATIAAGSGVNRKTVPMSPLGYNARIDLLEKRTIMLDERISKLVQKLHSITYSV